MKLNDGINKKIKNLLASSDKNIAIIVPLGYNGILFSRALRAKGVKCIGIINSKKNIFYYTNSCEKIIFQDICGEKLLQLLIKLGESASKKPVLIPVADLNTLLFSKYRAELSKYYLFNLPSQWQVDTLLDKTKFYEWGKDEFNFPKSVIIRNSSDLNIALEEMRFPVVFKPKYRNESWHKIHLSKATVFYNAKDLLSFYNLAKRIEDTFLVSEHIEGKDSNIETCHVYYSKGKVLTTYTDRKIRQYPPYLGTGSFVSSCINPEIENTAIKIFDKLKYTGIGGMEFKKDDRAGEYKIIEAFVGRPSSHFYTGLGEGINLPYLVYCDIIGKEYQVKKQSHKTVSLIDEEPDLKSALYYILKKELSIKDYVKSLLTARVFVRFSVSDPLPGIMFIFGFTGKIINFLIKNMFQK